MSRTHTSDTSQPIDGSEGGYHDPYPTQSIDSVTAGMAEVEKELAPFNGVAPHMHDKSGRTAIQFWNLHYLYASLSLSQYMKQKKANA